jgi:hypothetical protein
MGHIVGREEVKVDPEKIQAMQEWPRPMTLKRLRGLISLTSYYKNFFHHYGKIASGTSLGAVLTKDGRHVAFTSKVLSGCNLGISTYEKEMMVILHAVHSWRPYLLGCRFQIKIDHHSLEYFLEQWLSSPKQNKWMTKMLGYDYEIIYKKGKDNIVADALSRKHEEEGSLFSLSLPIPDWIEEVYQEWLNQPNLS